MSNTATPTQVIGANVRAELARANRSQAWLGEHLGVSQGQVSARLAGRTPIDVNELVTIAGLLAVPVATLLGEITAAAS